MPSKYTILKIKCLVGFIRKYVWLCERYTVPLLKGPQEAASARHAWTCHIVCMCKWQKSGHKEIKLTIKEKHDKSLDRKEGLELDRKGYVPNLWLVVWTQAFPYLSWKITFNILFCAPFSTIIWCDNSFVWFAMHSSLTMLVCN